MEDRGKLEAGRSHGNCNGDRYQNLFSFEAETVVQSGQLIILE